MGFERIEMRKEWLGMLIGLGGAGAFSACESDSSNDGGNTSTSRAQSSTSTAQASGGNGGDGAAGPQGGGGSGGVSQGGAGGGGACNSGPQPVGNIADCGGTAASNGSGGFFCSLMCDDAAANTYEVECNLDTGQCDCKYNGQVLC